MGQTIDLVGRKVRLPPNVAEIAMASKVPIVVSNAALPDMPLIIVNDAFCAISGRNRDEVLGRNCRFLQPKTGAELSTKKIRNFLQDDKAQEGNFILPNIRKDGSKFLNLLYLAKLRNKNGVQFVLGSQFDITNTSLPALKAYGEALHHDMVAMNVSLRRTNFDQLPEHDDLAETLAYVETYRQARGISL